MQASRAATDALVALLRELRVAAGLRQVDVAERLGEPQSFVAKYEAADRRLDVLELRAVAQALDTTLPAVVAQLEERLEAL